LKDIRMAARPYWNEAALSELMKAGQTIEVKPAEDDRSNVIDLMDALKQSMRKRSSTKRTTRRAPSKRRHG
jgi:non-homologous end joining protein Ku